MVKPGGIYLSGYVAMGDILLKYSLMAMVNLSFPPTPLSRKLWGLSWLSLNPTCSRRSPELWSLQQIALG